MEDLIIITADYPGGTSWLLRDSCERVGVRFQTYGSFQRYPGHTQAKLIEALKCIRQLTSEYVMYTDGSDAFISQGEDAILEGFCEVGSDILVSAEKNLYPDTSLIYPTCWSPWKYVNAGGWMGRREALIPHLEHLIDISTDSNDQLAWSRWYVQEEHPNAALDVGCKVFQTMYMVSPGDISEDGLNTITGSRPSVWHFNGRQPGLEEWYSQLKVHSLA
jgi:hypothetical protein